MICKNCDGKGFVQGSSDLEMFGMVIPKEQTKAPCKVCFGSGHVDKEEKIDIIAECKKLRERSPMVIDFLKAGSMAQLEKLGANMHKTWFSECDYCLSDWLDLLMGEVEELGSAIDNEPLEAIRREAADVANYAHAIINYCDTELKNGEH